MFKRQFVLICIISCFIALSTLTFSCQDGTEHSADIGTVETSSPQKAAKAFWEALKRNDVETAKKYYITLDEASQIGPLMAKKMSEKLHRELKQLEELAPRMQGSEWVGLIISEEETYMGTQGIGMNISLIKDGQNIQLPVMFWEVKKGYWKLNDVY